MYEKKLNNRDRHHVVGPVESQWQFRLGPHTRKCVQNGSGQRSGGHGTADLE